MISVPVQVDITSGIGPFTYQWQTDNSCVTFSKVSDVITGTSFQTVLTFVDEACISAATISVNITSSCGNTENIPVTITNPCDAFVVNPITSSETFVYVVSAARPGCPSVTFAWTFDTALFTKVSQVNSAFASTLRLALKAGVSPPSNTLITAKVTDCRQCVKQAMYSQSVCVPQAVDIVVDMYSFEGITTGFLSGNITFPDPGGCPEAIDYDSFSFNLPSGFSATPLTGNGEFFFLAPDTTNLLQSGSYTVANEQGIISSIGNITFVLHPATTKTITAPDKVITLECTSQAGETIIIPIQDDLVVSPGATVDWDSFEVVTPPTPLSPSITLGLSGGKYSIFYVVPTPPAADVFSWLIRDTNGTPTQAIVYTIRDCVQAPTATDDAADATCGNSTIINVIQNDLGNGSPIDPTSIVITQNPTKGTVSKQNNGTVIYTAFLGVSGADTFKYKVKNANGVFTNEATVTVTIYCSGEDANIILCDA